METKLISFSSLPLSPQRPRPTKFATHGRQIFFPSSPLFLLINLPFPLQIEPPNPSSPKASAVIRTYTSKRAKRACEGNPPNPSKMKKPSEPQSGSSRVPPSSKPSPSSQPHQITQPQEKNLSMHASPPTQQRVRKGSIAWREMMRKMGHSRRRTFEEEAQLQAQLQTEAAKKEKEVAVNHPSSVLQVQT